MSALEYGMRLRINFTTKAVSLCLERKYEDAFRLFKSYLELAANNKDPQYAEAAALELTEAAAQLGIPLK